LKLYPYQENAVNHALDMLSRRNNSLIVAGTGAGKTIMMAAAIGRFFDGFRAMHKRSPHILVLVHRTEIHTQNHGKFSLVNPHIPTSEITSARKSLHGYVHFGMVQTVLNLLPEFERAGSSFDLIVIDEAHHAKASTYEEIIEWNRKLKPGTALLGVTATPNRGDKLPLIHLFDNFYQITTRFLIESHYLVRPKFLDLSPVFEGKDGLEKGHLAKNCKSDANGDILVEKLCMDFFKYKQPGKSIIFAPTHEFCARIVRCLRKMGRNPAYLGLGLDSVSRSEELKRFEDGECEELINVDICTEGYDFPPLRNLVDFDTNGTQSQWIQKVGRVLRTAPGKAACTVIDFGGNVELYPEGVETEVALEGAVKKRGGRRLTERDLFRTEEEKSTAAIEFYEEKKFTPYHLPDGFESVYDRDFGVVYAACGKTADCIMTGSDDGVYTLFCGNKESIRKCFDGEFSDCIERGIAELGDVPPRSNREISPAQVKLLAPEYPTTAMDWNSANCCICWKTWKDVVACLN